MSATELDVPVLMSSEQIRRREFVVTRRGYDPGQVRDYLDQLADQVDVMAAMIREARLEAEAALNGTAEPREDPYDRLARRVASVIKEADEAAERFRMTGRRDAERVLHEARGDADRIRSEAEESAAEARRGAERALEEAREQADRTLAGLSTRREAVVEQLAVMQERLLGVARDLEATIVAPEMETAADTIAGPAIATPSMPAPGPARIVDVRVMGDPPPPPPVAEAGSVDELFADLDEGGEDLWGGTDAIGFEVPDIPALDLDWGDDEGEGAR